MPCTLSSLAETILLVTILLRPEIYQTQFNQLSTIIQETNKQTANKYNKKTRKRKTRRTATLTAYALPLIHSFTQSVILPVIYDLPTFASTALMPPSS